MPLMRFSMVMFLLAVPARAEVPRVVTDIAPVHSMVAMVMAGVGTPDLIVTPGVSPHGYGLRPSQARALQAADIVVWIGPELTPWLVKPIDTLAPDATRLALLAETVTQTHPFREAQEESQDHDPAHEDHAGIDPHAWLDPQNGQIWLGLIADRLARADPDNAARYRSNAKAGQSSLAALEAELSEMLAPMRGRVYVTFHEAYQYFEARFGLTPTGAVALSDASDPSPVRLARLRDEVAALGITCGFSEPQFDPGLLNAITDANLAIIPLDPMGSQLEVGAGLYPALLRDMGAGFAACANHP